MSTLNGGQNEGYGSIAGQCGRRRTVAEDGTHPIRNLRENDDRQKTTLEQAIGRRTLFAAAGGGIAATVVGSGSVSAQAAAPAETAPPSGEYVVDNVAVLSMDDTIGILPRGAIHVKDGKIAAIAARIEAPGVTRVGGSGKIAMPGLVDAHWHMWNTLFKNMVTPQRGYSAPRAVPAGRRFRTAADRPEGVFKCAGLPGHRADLASAWPDHHVDI